LSPSLRGTTPWRSGQPVFTEAGSTVPLSSLNV
jgi:hypothetical protein